MMYIKMFFIHNYKPIIDNKHKLFYGNDMVFDKYK